MNNKKKKKKNQNQNSGSFAKAFLLFFLATVIWTADSCKDGGQPVGNISKDSIPVELKNLNRAISEHPEIAENYYKRSLYFYREQKFADAVEDIGKAINMEPGNPLYHFRIGEYLFSLNQTKKAALAFEKAVELKPDYTEALQKLGELYLIVKEYGKSDSCWHRLYELDKTNSKAAYYRGLMYKDKGDTAKAVQSFQYAADLEEKYVEPRLQLGIIYASKNNPACLGYFEAVLREQPKSWEAYFARGDYFMRKHMNKQAIADFDMVLFYNRQNFMANYNAGVILYTEGKYKKAADQFANVIDKNPEYHYAYISRAMCNSELGLKNLAIADLQQALVLDSTNVNAKSMLKKLQR